jgi:uncharacterized protein
MEELQGRFKGKTTLALSLADEIGKQALYLDLELPSDCAKLSDPELYLSEHEDHLVILDEIHRLPGSVFIDLLHQSAETLAGRLACRTHAVLRNRGGGIAPASQLWVRGGLLPSFKSIWSAMCPRSDYVFRRKHCSVIGRC